MYHVYNSDDKLLLEQGYKFLKDLRKDLEEKGKINGVKYIEGYWGGWMPTLSLTKEEAVIALQFFQKAIYECDDPRIVNLAKKLLVSLRKEMMGWLKNLSVLRS